MEIETTLAKYLRTAKGNAAYDAACKRLLANKSILAWIMKSCLGEYKDCEVNEIVEKYIEGEPQITEIAVNPDEEASGSEQIEGAGTEDSTINEGTIFYDIRFYAVVPHSDKRIRLIINVEAQNNFYPGYPILKRGIYYCGRMLSSQYGVEFTDTHYEKLKKVYSIWICARPPKYRENTITRYVMKEENVVGTVREKKEYYDLLTVVMICLGDSEKENCGGILKLLEVLLSGEKKAEEKKKILQEEFAIKMTKALEGEVQSMCNLSIGVEEKGLRKGLEEGWRKGQEEGRREGAKEGVLISIRNLMASMNWSAEQAMKALQIPEAEQPMYAADLER